MLRERRSQSVPDAQAPSKLRIERGPTGTLALNFAAQPPCFMPLNSFQKACAVRTLKINLPDADL
jgi:hypothetical protein